MNSCFEKQSSACATVHVCMHSAMCACCPSTPDICVPYQIPAESTQASEMCDLTSTAMASSVHDPEMSLVQLLETVAKDMDVLLNEMEDSIDEH